MKTSKCVTCKHGIVKYMKKYKGYVVGCKREDKMDVVKPGGTTCYEPKENKS